MPSERAERIRLGYENWDQEGERELPPDFEFHPPTDLPGAKLYRGPGAIAEFGRALAESFGSLRIEPLEIDERGDHVIAHVRLEASGRTARSTSAARSSTSGPSTAPHPPGFSASRRASRRSRQGGVDRRPAIAAAAERGVG